MSPYPVRAEHGEGEKTHVIGQTVEAHNRGKQETKGILTGAF